MPTIDRAAALRNAEKLLRQGKLEAAIAEYVRVVEEQPDDWSTANTLGDLYVRAGQIDSAVQQFTRIADSLSSQGFVSKAGALYKKILKLQPEDEHALLKAGEIAAGQGLIADARAYWSAVEQRRRARGDSQGAAEVRIRIGSADPADYERRVAAAMARAELGDRATAVGELQTIAGELVEKGRPDEAFRAADAAVEMIIAGADYPGAAAALKEFVGRVPNHVPALVRLIEVCVDGGLEFETYEAQAKLAEAYFAGGSISDARAIAEDLVVHQSSDEANVDRLRRILVAMNEPDPDAIIALRRSGLMHDPEPIDEGPPPSEPAVPEVPDVEPPEPVFPARRAPERPRDAAGEIDLSIALEEIKRPPEPTAPDLDGVFEQLRDEASARPNADASDADYKRAFALWQSGDVEACIGALESAARTPKLRFAATSMLGAIMKEQGRIADAIEWFELAAEAPAPSPAAYHQVLYELADGLESIGEATRALAVCLELQAEAGPYRDVPVRIERLAKAEA